MLVYLFHPSGVWICPGYPVFYNLVIPTGFLGDGFLSISSKKIVKREFFTFMHDDPVKNTHTLLFDA